MRLDIRIKDHAGGTVPGRQSAGRDAAGQCRTWSIWRIAEIREYLSRTRLPVGISRSAGERQPGLAHSGQADAQD